MCICNDNGRSNGVWRISGSGNGSTGGNDGVVRFQKVLEMQKAAGASVPDVTYTYTIVPGTGIGATATSPEVKPGVGTPVVSDVSYTNTDTITQQEVVKTASITFPEDFPCTWYLPLCTD
mgnify:CR=1 FL=1